MSSKKLNALVVGGSGFMGSHVADALSQAGYHVTIYDHSKSPWLKENQTFVQGDLLDKAKLSSVTQNQDVVYHFAAIADIGEASAKRVQSIEVNILGSTYLIESCVQNKVKTFIFASTVYVYSDQGSFYRVTKQAVENIIEEYAKTENMDYRILRYGSLYGPRAQPWNGLRKYVESIINTNSVTLKSEGLAKREYIHVLDAARLSVEALDTKYKNQHLQLTGSQSITANELIQTIGEMLGKKVNINYTTETTDSHYVLTPYKYVPKHGHKITSNDFIDLGQGLLEIIEDVHHTQSQSTKK